MRVLTLTVALAALLAAPPAQAAVSSTAVTSPGGTTYTAPVDTTSGAAAQTIDVAGTSNGGASDKVDVRCYSGPNASDFDTLVAGVAVDGQGGWDTGAVSLAPLAGETCTLRAVPAGTNPGSLGSFAGPTLAVDSVEHVSAGSTPVDYHFAGTQQTGRFRYSSAGHCGVESSELLGAGFLPTDPLFDCGAAFYLSDNLANDLTNSVPSTDSDRSEIRIDTHDAYAPYQASIAFNDGSTSSASSTGLPSVFLHDPQVDGSSGDVELQETEQIVKCPDAAKGSTNSPPSPSNCPSFAPANVRLDRFITQSQNGSQVTVTDDWSSADGRAHTLDVLYDQGLAEAQDYGAGPGYRLSGQSAFSTHATGDTLPDALPAVASMFVEPRRDAPDGDPANPQGALSWDTPPAAGVFSSSDEFVLGYVLGIPAGGAVVMRFVYSQATTAAGAARLASLAEQALRVPAVVPAAPGGGPTISGVAALLHRKPSGLSPSRCRVPRLRGLTRTKATRALRRAGCRLFRVRHARSHVKKGRVVRSHPGAGAKRPLGARVSITVSTGRRHAAHRRKRRRP